MLELRPVRPLILLLLGVTLAGCAQLPQLPLLAPRVEPAERLARSVTIARDEWGVPTIYGPTDAAVAFGLAYAQAEDNYWQIEDDYIHALGRASHYYGDRYLAADLVKAAFEVVRLSREEYEREPADRRAVWDAFAHGLNYYLRTSGVQPRLITRWEPWMFFARLRHVGAGTVVDGVRLGDIARDPSGEMRREGYFGRDPSGEMMREGYFGRDTAGEVMRERYFGRDTAGEVMRERYSGRGDAGGVMREGSNAWAVAPGRTAGGHALLFQNPHVGFFGSGQRYEMQVHSDAGWHVRGFAILGTPMPRSGHNEHLAWSHTNTAADHSDVYEVRFDHPTDPLLYRYDGDWRRAVEWEDTLQVNTSDGVVSRAYRFRRTHHGPVVAMRDGVALAVRVGRMEEGGSLQQWYDMGRAASLDEFRNALNQRALPISNTLYADRVGNIYYLHGNAVPRRDPAYDWSRPVDGSTSATEWQGWHELNELPELLNPASGWLQNTNSSPFLATADGHNLDPANYPAYMAREPDNARARSSRRLLDNEQAWTFDAWAAAAFDTYVIEAEDALRILVHEWEQVGGTNVERAMALDEAVDALRAWDRVSTVESEAMTLFTLWQERLRSGEFGGEFAAFRALEDVVSTLRRDFGRPLVAWGDVNRLQRVHTSGEQPFSDELPSLPVAGAPGWTGIIFNFSAQPGPGGRRYGTFGHTWVSVVELAPQVRSRSVVPFGQSADPASPNWFDQAPLYAAGALKLARFTRDDVLASARRVYRPGDR